MLLFMFPGLIRREKAPGSSPEWDKKKMKVFISVLRAEASLNFALELTTRKIVSDFQWFDENKLFLWPILYIPLSHITWKYRDCTEACSFRIIFVLQTFEPIFYDCSVLIVVGNIQKQIGKLVPSFILIMLSSMFHKNKLKCYDFDKGLVGF